MRLPPIFLCALLLHAAGCSKFTYEASNESRGRFDVVLTCQLPRIEVGLRLLKPIATERLGNIALIRIRSAVHVTAKDDVEVLSPSVEEGPVSCGGQITFLRALNMLGFRRFSCRERSAVGITCSKSSTVNCHLSSLEAHLACVLDRLGAPDGCLVRN